MSDNRDLISVIVPVYNVEQYLSQCLDSILKQTYSNLEIILVDDESKDSSGKICDEYCRKDKRCKVIHKKNAGLGMARNSGLEIATGLYVTFVDSDDWIKADAIEQMHRNLIEHNVDFCKSGYIRFTDDGKIIRTVHYEEECFPENEAKKKLLPRMVGSSPSQHDSVEMCVTGVLYSVRIIKSNKLKFPSERVLISEDMVFNIDYMQHTNGGCLIPYEGYMYRYNPKSLTSQYREDRFNAVCYWYSEVKKQLLGYGYDKSTIYRLQRIFFVYLRMCLTQERSRVSKHTAKESIERIKKICENSTVRNIIQNYPLKNIGFKQSIFLKLIIRKRAFLLRTLVEVGVI